MNDLQKVFEYRGSQVRTIVKDGEPWVVAKDVVEGIGAVWNGSQAIAHIPEQWKGSERVLSPGGEQEMAVLSEPGAYFYLTRSDKPKALPFQMWLAGDVLPSIRKTGGYGQHQITGNYGEFQNQLPTTFSACLRMLADQVEQNALMAPKAESFDTFLSTKGAQPMNEVAKALGTGRTRLFAILRGQDILMGNNLPRQIYIERGYFEVRETSVVAGFNVAQTLVTSKGVDYIGKLLTRVND